MFLAKKLAAALILPPTGPLLMTLCGLCLAHAKSRRRRYGGFLLVWLSIGSLLLLSLPVVGHALLKALEHYSPINQTELRTAQAIVILGAGSYYAAPEYGADTVSASSLERLRYGARLARQTRLPLLVTGGAPYGGRAEGESMREVLVQDFGIHPRWVEVQARDTAENATYSAALLKSAAVKRIALVSHGWHLPRAVRLFEREGLEVVAAPTAFSTDSPSLWENLLPGAGLRASRRALNEYLGLIFNRLKESYEQ